MEIESDIYLIPGEISCFSVSVFFWRLVESYGDIRAITNDTTMGLYNTENWVALQKRHSN